MKVIRAHSLPVKPAPDLSALTVLTLAEAATELRCSRKRLSDVVHGRVAGLPPLPVFRIGRDTFIRRARLDAWIRMLEDIAFEDSYAIGPFGHGGDWESIGGA